MRPSGWPPTNKGRLLITTAKHNPKSSRSEHLSLGKFSKTSLKREPGSSKQIGKTPYIVSKTVEGGAYHLLMIDGTLLLRPWNISNLKQYYQ